MNLKLIKTTAFVPLFLTDSSQVPLEGSKVVNHLQKLRSLPASRRVAFVALFICIFALLASTANGIYFATTRRAEFVSLFPGAVGFLYASQLVTAALGIVSLVGLALLRRWAFWVFLATSLLAIVLDLLTGAPVLHLVAASVSSALVLALGYINRSCFEGRRDVA